MHFSTLKVAWRNLGRNRRRTVLALGAIALGQLTLVAVNGMMAGVFEEVLQTITGPLVGHVQIHHKEWREERAIDLYIDDLSKVKAQIQQLPSVKSISTRIYSPVLAASGEETDKPADAEAAMIVGVDVDVESKGGGILESLRPRQLPGAREVVVGKVLATRLNLKPGQQIAVIGQDADEFPTSDLFVVKAVMRGNVDVINRMGIVMPIADAGEFLAMPNQAHEIIVHGEDHRKSEQLAAAVRSLPPLENAEVLPWREAAPELVAIINMKKWSDLIFVAVLFIAAAAGIANTMMMSTFERTHEFGHVLEPPSAHRVDVVDAGRVLREVRGLNSALGHRGVRVAQPELRRKEDARSLLLSDEGGGRTCTSATYDQNIDFAVDPREVKFFWVDHAVGLEQVGEFVGCFIPLVRPNLDLPRRLGLVVGVKLVQELGPLLERELGQLLFYPLSPRPLELFYRLLHLLRIHQLTSFCSSTYLFRSSCSLAFTSFLSSASNLPCLISASLSSRCFDFGERYLP